jgi:hypothetical protein
MNSPDFSYRDPLGISRGQMKLKSKSLSPLGFLRVLQHPDGREMFIGFFR